MNNHSIAQWFIKWVGGEDQAQRESYIEIHQHYPYNHANRHHIKIIQARKLKFHVRLKIYHTKLLSEDGQDLFGF